MISVKRTKHFKEQDLKDLFTSVGWESAVDSDLLVKAFKKSTRIISAWDNKKLVGLIRCMDDNLWSANIDCLVVHSDYQNQGIASLLMTELLEKVKHIKYINVCPDHKETFSFYFKFGFEIVNGYFLQRKQY